MKIKPLFDRVIIEQKKEGNMTASGIVLPETSEERPQIGKVISVGDGVTFDGQKVDMQVKVGDTIVYNRYTGSELKLDGKNYIVLRQIDIIGVLND